MLDMMVAPTAQHIGEDDLPWAYGPDGIGLKVLQIKESEGLWVIKNQFPPDYSVQTHKHTGQVFAYTSAGAWGYKESDFLNRAGSFLYEPAGSIHTLYTPEDNTETTEVFFAIWGANLNMDAEGNIESITDGQTVLMGYYFLLEEQGTPRPDNILLD